MNMFFLKTLPEDLFFPKKGKIKENKNSGIGWSRLGLRVDSASSYRLGVIMKLRVEGEQVTGKTKGNSS